MGEEIVKLNSVSVVFQSHAKETRALQDISLSFAQGEKIAVVGPSGCGKSTLLRCLCGFIPPASGEILFHNARVKNIQKKMGYMFQHYALFPWMTVYDNVAFALKMKSSSAGATASEVNRLLKLVHLDEFTSHFPSQLSGGMRQRVALARLLAHDSEIFLMDEPFSALDAMTRWYLRDEVISLLRQTGKTLVVVTHDIEEACLIAERIIVLSSRPGTVKQIIENPLPYPRTDASTENLQQQIWEIVKEEVEKTIKT